MSNKFGVSIKWLSVSCFEIRCDGVTVVSDPFVTDCDNTDLTWEAIEKCDILCLTHAHFDHITDIPKLVEKYKPLLLCDVVEVLAGQIAAYGSGGYREHNVQELGHSGLHFLAGDEANIAVNSGEQS